MILKACGSYHSEKGGRIGKVNTHKDVISFRYRAA